MLSSVTLNCQATKILMNSGSQLSKLKLVSQMSQVHGIVYVIVFVFVFVIVFCLGHVMSPHHSDQMFQRSEVSGIAL